jgi:hypothetical protein
MAKSMLAWVIWFGATFAGQAGVRAQSAFDAECAERGAEFAEKFWVIPIGVG